MWDLIVSVSDHCSSFYFIHLKVYDRTHKKLYKGSYNLSKYFELQ